MKAAVLSDGAWGTALAIQLVKNGHEVYQWGPFPDYIEEMKKTGRNDRFLKGAELPEGLKLDADMATCVKDAAIIVLASPTQYARSTIEKLAECGVEKDQILVNVAKGVEVGTLKRLSEMTLECIPNCKYCALSGPSHAEEVYQDVPTLVVVASEDHDNAEAVQEAFMSDNFRVYTSDDVTGVELGGALKNVYAIAAGVCDGMSLGDNTKAALLTRAVAEMSRMGIVLGGHPETFSGLSGLGDLIVTCTSGHSRNRHVGEELGKGESLDDIIAGMGMVVAEGVATAKSAYHLAAKADVDVPIITEIYNALYEGKDSRVALRELMTRDARPERDGMIDD